MAISQLEYQNARDRAVTYFENASIIITDDEKDQIEVADFGLSRLDEIGVELITYINTDRVCAKEVVLFPWQICPEHRHPSVGEKPGKEETFRCRWGEVYLYIDGQPTQNSTAKVPANKADQFTVWHEVILKPGDQVTVEANQLHWFQGGPDGAVLSEFSTPSTDEYDVFTDPAIVRMPEIY